MKFTITRDHLAAATGWVTSTARTGRGALPSPILAGLLVDAGADGTLTVAGYDYEVSARYRTGAAGTGEPGRALIPARMLAQAAASLPAGHEVTLTADGARAVLTAGQVTYTLMLLPHEEYPPLPEPGEPVAEFGAGHLAAAVAQVVTAAARDDTLPALTCVHLSLDGEGTATLTATDRYRLATVTCPYTPRGQGELPGAVLIPAASLAAAVRHPDTATVVLGFTGQPWRDRYRADGTAVLTADGREVTIRTIAAEFPRITPLIPGGDDSEHPITATVTAGAGELAAAVKRAAVVAERNTPVRLGITPAGLHLEAGTGDDAAYTDDLEVACEGDTFTIAFRPGYLLDALGSVTAAGGATVRLALTSPARPALLTPAEPSGPVACRHVLMPVRGSG